MAETINAGQTNDEIAVYRKNTQTTTITMRHIFIRSLSTILLTLSVVAAGTAADFDRDGKADPAVFRPSTSTWFLGTSGVKSAMSAFQWGHTSDVPTAADYDGDGRTDVAVWRPENGVWYIYQSGDDSVLLVRWGTTTMHPTGGLPDVPVAADYDGDGRTDIGVFRPDTGEWWVLKSSTRYDHDKATIFRWGKLGDVPVQGDYDGDRRTDFAVFRSTENRWYILESSTGRTSIRSFGLAGLDTLVPADYTGDGKTDLAVYRGSVWYVMDSTTFETDIFHFGFHDDRAVPADYDGDGSTDFATYRNGTWYIHESSGGRLRSLNFGLAGDLPISSSVIRHSVIAIP